ncbi:MAG: hypothetical protein K2X66_06905 [Cyanobacteria bacterium]|nr:hypothetical protein [Cyanobacteriota bacterium]
MLLKLLIKLFLKLVFFGKAAYSLSVQEYKGKSGLIYEKLSQAEKDGNEAFESVSRKFSNLESQFEEHLNGKANGKSPETNSNGSYSSSNRKPASNSNGNGNDYTQEKLWGINDMRSELAELRADIRELKRRVAPPSPHDPHS